MTDRRLRDSEIFFGALAALAGALVGSRVLAAIVAGQASIAFAPSLMSRFGPLGTIANFSTFFVLLPVALVFIAIGIPFALRSAAAALRRDLERREQLGLVAVLASIVMLFVEGRSGGGGLVSLVGLTLLAYWQLWPALTERGARLGQWSAVVSGASALGLAAYQWSFLGGAAPSLFIAPTLLVIAFYAGSLAAVCEIPVAAVALASRRGFPLAALVIISATAGWLASPSIRMSAVSLGQADIWEFAAASGCAAVLAIAGLIARLRA